MVVIGEPASPVLNESVPLWSVLLLLSIGLCVLLEIGLFMFQSFKKISVNAQFETTDARRRTGQLLRCFGMLERFLRR